MSLQKTQKSTFTVKNTIETRVKKLVFDYMVKFKNDYMSQCNLQLKNLKNEIVSGENCIKNLIQFVSDYETLEITHEDLQKKKITKPSVPMEFRCIAMKNETERCIRKKQKKGFFCGIHAKSLSLPFGSILSSSLCESSMSSSSPNLENQQKQKTEKNDMHKRKKKRNITQALLQTGEEKEDEKEEQEREEKEEEEEEEKLISKNAHSQHSSNDANIDLEDSDDDDDDEADDCDSNDSDDDDENDDTDNDCEENEYSDEDDEDDAGNDNEVRRNVNSIKEKEKEKNEFEDDTHLLINMTGKGFQTEKFTLKSKMTHQNCLASERKKILSSSSASSCEKAKSFSISSSLLSEEEIEEKRAQKMKELEKLMHTIEIWAEEYKGIIFYIDNYNNVYDGEEIWNISKMNLSSSVTSSSIMPKTPNVIGTYTRNDKTNLIENLKLNEIE